MMTLLLAPPPPLPVMVGLMGMLLVTAALVCIGPAADEKQSQHKSDWRFGCGERLTKICHGHLGCSRDATADLILTLSPNFRILDFGCITNDSNPIQYPALINTEGQQWQI
jgi:hypothetical protein